MLVRGLCWRQSLVHHSCVLLPARRALRWLCHGWRRAPRLLAFLLCWLYSLFSHLSPLSPPPSSFAPARVRPRSCSSLQELQQCCTHKHDPTEPMRSNEDRAEGVEGTGQRPWMNHA